MKLGLSPFDWTLLALASIFFLESSFEMFALTSAYGPQMLFFSLAHTAGSTVIAVLLVSVVAYVALFFYGAARFALARLGKSPTPSRRATLLGLVSCVLAVHFALLTTYDAWSRALFAHAG